MNNVYTEMWGDATMAALSTDRINSDGENVLLGTASFVSRHGRIDCHISIHPDCKAEREKVVKLLNKFIKGKWMEEWL